jgi:hypothetical protein
MVDEFGTEGRKLARGAKLGAGPENSAIYRQDSKFGTPHERGAELVGDVDESDGEPL